MMEKFSVEEFRFLKTDDVYDEKYNWWSRIYEYPYVLNKLNLLGANNDSKIHNTSWGFEGCHVTFKNDLDLLYNNVIHSDIKESNLPKTMFYDITKKIEEKYVNYFDFVVNVSTVEEVNYPNNLVIDNLLEQVKIGGFLIITFDYKINDFSNFGNGSINLECVEQYMNKKIKPLEDVCISGEKSLFPQIMFSDLRCGVMVLKKIF